MAVEEKWKCPQCGDTKEVYAVAGPWGSMVCPKCGPYTAGRPDWEILAETEFRGIAVRILRSDDMDRKMAVFIGEKEEDMFGDRQLILLPLDKYEEIVGWINRAKHKVRSEKTKGE